MRPHASGSGTATPRGEGNAVREGRKLVRPRIPEAMRVAPEDLAVDRALKEVPCPVTEISRGPEPERTLSPAPSLLYHLGDDPYERHDLAPQEPQRVRRLESRWRAGSPR